MTTWEEFPIITISDAEALRSSPEWTELYPSFNGWYALIVWAVGPKHVVRCPDDPSTWTNEVWTNDEGYENRRVIPNPNRDDVYDDNDAYLADAEVPPQPRVFRWFVHLPEGMTAVEWERPFVQVQWDVSEPATPDKMRPGFEVAARQLYGD